MRYVYIRGISGMVWMGAAVVCGVSGSPGMAVFYGLLGVFFLYAARTEYRKAEAQRGDR